MPETSPALAGYRITNPVKGPQNCRPDWFSGCRAGANFLQPRRRETPRRLHLQFESESSQLEPARAAIEESHGAIDIVSDEEILVAQSWLARHEGIFVEPQAAAGIARTFQML